MEESVMLNGPDTPNEKQKRCRFIGFLLFLVHVPHEAKVKEGSVAI